MHREVYSNRRQYKKWKFFTLFFSAARSSSLCCGLFLVKDKIHLIFWSKCRLQISITQRNTKTTSMNIGLLNYMCSILGSLVSAVCNVAFMAMFNLKKITYSWYYVLVKLRLLCMLNFVLQTRNFAKRTRETSAKDANVRKWMAVDRRSTVTWLGTLYDSYPRYKKKYFLRNVLLKKL